MVRTDQRKLSAILAADVVGFSRLMGEDETGTLDALRRHHREVVEPKIGEHGGRIVKLMGDGILAEFTSAVEAVMCAIDIQVLMRTRNEVIPEQRQIVLRVGINIGDVIIDGDDIYGDGVNLAARLEALADPGGICISRNVREQVRDRLPVAIEDRGETTVKNIARPVRIFAIVLDEETSALATDVAIRPRRPNRAFAVIPYAAAVIAIIAALVAGWYLWGPRPDPDVPMTGTVPDAGKPSIAVLPFDNLSESVDQEYFADGLTDDLITDLSKISGVIVIARSSSFAYKDRANDLSAIARELGVRYVLDGSVRRAGNAVRINARLVDGPSGENLWAERYDREFVNIFAIQDEVITGIVDALSVQLTDEERIEVSQLPTENFEAYDYYLRAERLAYHAEAVAVADALSLYQRAIALDRDFADAYAGYARVAVDVLNFGFFDNLPSAVARKRAYEMASRAAQLNPRLARSYSVLALLQMLDGEHDNASASAHKAISLSPNDADAHLNLAVVLIYAGRHDEALQEMETVMRLNPKAPDHVREYHALALYMSGRYEAALAVLQQELTEASSDLVLELVAGANARLDRFEVAEQAVSAMIKRLPETSVSWLRVHLSHHARAEDLAARTEALRLAGLPEWPHGFEGAPADRLDGAAIDALSIGRTWIGERVGVGPFIRYADADGRFVERGPGYQLVGITSRREGMLCIQSEAALLGRPTCAPVFRNSSGTSEERNEYTYPSAYGLHHFTLMD